MSLTYLKGDLLDFPNDIQVIAHSCNCFNRFGKGIALQIRTRYPEAYEADTIASINGTNVLGNFSSARLARQPSRSIYNLYTQYTTSNSHRMVDYEAFYKACNKFQSKISDLQNINNKTIRVGFPYGISCKNAGGSWTIIEAIIRDLFDRPEFEAFIVRNPLYD